MTQPTFLKTLQNALRRIAGYRTSQTPRNTPLQRSARARLRSRNDNRTEILANHGLPGAGMVAMVNDFRVIQDNWVQITPLGDYPNQGPVDKGGRPKYPGGVIQRVDRAAVTEMVNEFEALKKEKGADFGGLPWYVGHPDMDRATYNDAGAYGWVMELKDGGEQGLMGRVKWTEEGEKLKTSGKFKYFSPCWNTDTEKASVENGKVIMRPSELLSVGFTNIPQIPVRPLANEQARLVQAAHQEALTELLHAAGIADAADCTRWHEWGSEDFTAAALALGNAGTREGALKGWETRRSGLASKDPAKAAAKATAKTKRSGGKASKAATKKATAKAASVMAKPPEIETKTPAAPLMDRLAAGEKPAVVEGPKAMDRILAGERPGEKSALSTPNLPARVASAAAAAGKSPGLFSKILSAFKNPHVHDGGAV